MTGLLLLAGLLVIELARTNGQRLFPHQVLFPFLIMGNYMGVLASKTDISSQSNGQQNFENTEQSQSYKTRHPTKSITVSPSEELLTRSPSVDYKTRSPTRILFGPLTKPVPTPSIAATPMPNDKKFFNDFSSTGVPTIHVDTKVEVFNNFRCL